MDSKTKAAVTEILEVLKPSGMSPENTPTCPEKFCGCGKKLEGEWVEDAVFNGKILQEAGWVFPLKCADCLSRPIELVPFDPVKQEEKLVRKLTSIFQGERPAKEFTFASFKADSENREALATAREFRAENNNLFVWGPCGVGKTHLASAIIREHVARGCSAIAMKPGRLMRFLRVKDSDLQESRICELTEVDLLFIDEMGLGNETAFAREMLQEIIDKRRDNYKNGLIITSNYSLEEYATKLGEDPIPSRLIEICRVVKVMGMDRRIVKKTTAPS